MTNEDDLLAAEYALGLLEGAEREAVQQRLGKDSVLAQRVEWWRERLEPLSAKDSVEPSDALWTKIEAALPGNDNTAQVQVRRWRAAALAATLVAALLGLTFALRPAPVPQQVIAGTEPAVPAAVLLASLAGDQGVVATVAYDTAAARLTIVPGKLLTSGGDAELWIIPEGGSPRSLGTLDPQHPSTAPARTDARALIARGATFAITREPRGGSPSGKPTGPILGSGTIGGT